MKISVLLQEISFLPVLRRQDFNGYDDLPAYGFTAGSIRNQLGCKLNIDRLVDRRIYKMDGFTCL